MKSTVIASLIAFVGATLLTPLYSCAEDLLPSWKSGEMKTALTNFVDNASRVGAPTFVPESERIAVFDNDGTLWSEKPMYFQALFAIDRVKAMAPSHPEWEEKEPFRSILAGDLKTALSSGDEALLEMITATHSGMTTEEFAQIVRHWLATATHPSTGKRYTQMVYRPMVEVLSYLRSRGFKTYIVTGGGVEFVRVFAEEVYGVPPEQVIGSSGKVAYEVRDGVPTLVKLPGIHFIDDKAGKPLAIHYQIGRRPVMAFGNSDGDFQMLEWVSGGAGPRFAAIVHHDDAAREWAYDRKSHVGKLDRGLDEASRRGWKLFSMSRDWVTVF
jgi:phosphoglycolate phosphatase-like HAD superfamily hydrolase